jgi:hypothetical protein
MFNILSFDYELFGSGKGCVFTHLIEPTRAILNVLKQFNVKATFFIEILEVEAIISMKYKYEHGSYEHKVALALEQQIEDMVHEGHDLQLHLHPQWINAQYENGSWRLNYDWWRFSALPEHRNGHVPSKSELIKSGVHQLEKRIQRIKPNYKCHSFRAGGYNLGVEKSSIAALVDNGIRIDSSVCHGAFAHTALSQFDYTSTDSSKSKWFSSDTILHGSDTLGTHEQCLEIPLLTVKSSFLERLSFARLYNSVRNRKFKGVNYSAHVSFKAPDRPEAITNSNFDVCLSSKRQISRFCSEIAKNGYEYVVLIGHPKDYSLFSPLHTVIQKLDGRTSFLTFDQIYQQVFA